LIRISTVVAFGRLHVVPRLQKFLDQYPEINVDVRLNDRVIDLVEEGVDVAIRMGTLADSSLIAKKLCNSPVTTVASPAYLKEHGIPEHPRDLRDHNYLVYSDGGSRSEIRFQEEGEPFFVRADGNFKTNNSEAMRTALLSGLGISRVSQWLVGDAIASGELVPVLSNFQPQPIDIHAVYPPGRHLPSKVRILIDYFTEEFKSCASIGGC
jgi:DNA-binding transcriptional LysR family regulator